METTEIVRILREYAVIHPVGRYGPDVRVEKSILSEAADRIERLEAERDDLRRDVETLHRINEDWRIEVARLHKRIDEARAAGMRLNGFAERPGTNYQKIAKKSPLQMAWWIWELGTVCDCCDLHGCCGIPEDEVTEEYCLEHILMWLAQEAK